MKRIVSVLMLLLVLFVSKESSALTLALAEDTVNITTNFSGKRIVVFGIKPEAGVLAVTLSGPRAYTIMRQKRPVLGMWMNARSVGFKDVPFLYDYAVEGAEENLANLELRQEKSVGVNALNYESRRRVDDVIFRPFHESLIRKKQQTGLFPLTSKPIEYIDGKLFRVNFELPADAAAGEYRINAYVFEEGVVRAETEARLQLHQAGFSAKLYNQAHNNQFFYGIYVVLFAVFSGFAAHFLFGRK